MRVRAHTRRLPSGKVVRVKSHTRRQGRKLRRGDRVRLIRQGVWRHLSGAKGTVTSVKGDGPLPVSVRLDNRKLARGLGNNPLDARVNLARRELTRVRKHR